jgi:RHS repeat-associated protein
LWIADGTTETIHRYTFFNENDQVAVFEKTEATAAASDQAKYADSISYVHRDILGSGELITDSRMNILARNFFSPYGEKVDDLLKAQAQAAGEQAYQAAKLGTGLIQSDSDDLGADLWTEFEQEGEADAFMSRYTAGASALDLSGVRGFTSHEEIQEMGLINMNARLYDPIIGRFMSADSIVPDLYTPLDHNRYSYVRGNPVSSRDPTGHSPLVFAAAFFAWTHYGDNPELQMLSTVLLQVAMMNPATTPFAAGANATANAAMHSGLTSLTISFLKSGKVDRKSLENAGIAAASAGLTREIAHGWIGKKAGLIGENVSYSWAKVTAVHMLTQGAISDLRGDKFIHGAIAGLAAKAGEPLTKGWGRYEGALVTATLSGVAAEATGGDFAQGALTGAIIHLYNATAGDAQKGNPATGIANGATKDGHLTHGEANEIWRANNDPSFDVTVDASKLTVLQTSEFNKNGIASGRVPYSETGDWLVHGSVTLSRGVDGVISIRPGEYDFQPHTPVRSFMTGVRNVETYGGFYVASRAGFSVGTDYLINYSGSPNVVR